MRFDEHELYGIDKSGLLKILNTTESDLNVAINNGYKQHRKKDKKGKWRTFLEPNSMLMSNQIILKDLFQKFDCDEYCKLGFKGQNALKNAQAHVGNPHIVTTDVSDFYPNTKEEFVRTFFKDILKVKSDAIEILVKMTTHKGQVPIGAPTSTLIAFFTHKVLFDKIANKMQELGILFTLYADDITLSSKHGITYKEIRWIQSVLDTHGLKLKSKKTKFYNYKKALITGFYVHQSGKITVPYWIGYTIIEKLNQTPLNKMDKHELCSLLGYINYQRMVDKKAFRVLHKKANKRLDMLIKMEQQQKIAGSNCVK